MRCRIWSFLITSIKIFYKNDVFLADVFGVTRLRLSIKSTLLKGGENMSTSIRRERFRYYRRLNNVSQRQLSIDLNVSDSHIRNIESGRGNPDVKLLFKLAKYLNTTPEELFPDLADVDLINNE